MLEMDRMFVMIVSLIYLPPLAAFIDQATPQQSTCQIQSYFARVYGSGRGNLLRVHLNNRGLPTSVAFNGTCDRATLKFTNFTEKRMIINGSMVATFRWTENKHYILAVKDETLVVERTPQTGFDRNHLFIIKSACEDCYMGLDKLETFSVPHLYVKSDSSGFPFMESVAGRMAWFEIVKSACP